MIKYSPCSEGCTYPIENLSCKGCLFHDMKIEQAGLRAMCDELACTILEAGSMTPSQQESFHKWQEMKSDYEDKGDADA